MEHRHGKRRNLPLELSVWVDNKTAVYTLADNISRNGVFVKVTHPDLQLHAFVHVVVFDAAHKALWDSQAMVIRTSPHGTALLFAERVPVWFFSGAASETVYAINTEGRLG